MLTTICNNKAMKKPTNPKRVGPLKSKPMKNMTTNKPPQQQPPLKVVYISNPMKIQTTTAQFRSLVQELTGQDAVDWSTPNPSSSPNLSSSSSSGQGPQKHLSRDVSENVSSSTELHLTGDVSRADYYDSGMLSWFGSDLECFGPLDGDCEIGRHDDRTVVVDNELDMSLIYEYLQQ